MLGFLSAVLEGPDFYMQSNEQVTQPNHNLQVMRLIHLIRSLEEHFPLQFFGRRQAVPLGIHLAQVYCGETGFKDCSEDLGHPGLLGRRAVVLDGDDDWVDGGVESGVLGGKEKMERRGERRKRGGGRHMGRV